MFKTSIIQMFFKNRLSIPMMRLPLHKTSWRPFLKKRPCTKKLLLGGWLGFYFHFPPFLSVSISACTIVWFLFLRPSLIFFFLFFLVEVLFLSFFLLQDIKKRSLSQFLILLQTSLQTSLLNLIQISPLISISPLVRVFLLIQFLLIRVLPTQVFLLILKLLCLQHHIFNLPPVLLTQYCFNQISLPKHHLPLWLFSKMDNPSLFS